MLAQRFPSTSGGPSAGTPSGSMPSAVLEMHCSLRFISGKYQGGEFTLSEGQELIIGRSSELDMVLVEEMVSRRHARISLQGGVISIEDLGSTNGTFVNGEKIERGILRDGDRVLIGTNILKVGAKHGAVSAGLTRPPPNRPQSRTSDEVSRMSGSLEEIPLPDLLQLFGTSRKSGVLVLRSGQGEARIYLEEGRIRFAMLEGAPNIDPLKAAYRVLDWKKGFFSLDPPESPMTSGDVLDLSAQEVLMEGFRLQDEFNTYREKLPPMSGRLVLRLPLEARLSELTPAELDLLQVVLNAPNLQGLFDVAQGSDVEIAQAVIPLIQRRYLEPVG